MRLHNIGYYSNCRVSQPLISLHNRLTGVEVIIERVVRVLLVIASALARRSVDDALAAERAAVLQAIRPCAGQLVVVALRYRVGLAALQ